MRTVVVTGSASGMGAATAARLTGDGHRVVGVDVRDADIVADLSHADGRRAAVDGVRERCAGGLDGVITFAGLAGLPGRAGGSIVAVNYFGTVAVLEGLRELLAMGDEPAAVAISSNSSTCQPDVPVELVDACLAGDEEMATAIGDRVGGLAAYPATKTAVARWVRRRAPTAGWIGAGITLNAISPGYIDTPMTEELRGDPTIGPLLGRFPIPVGRSGRPEELAGLAAFLLGPDARFLCGSVVLADGGTEALLRPDDWPTPWAPSS